MMRRIAALLLMILVAAGPTNASIDDFSKRFEPAFQQVRAMIARDPQEAADQAVRIKQQAARLADRRLRAITIAAAERLEGEALLQLSQLDRAENLIQRALVVAERLSPDSHLMAEILLTKGGLQAARRDTAAALKSYQSAFKLFERFSDQRNQAISLIYIAILYNDAHDNASSLKYYNQASDLVGVDAGLRFFIENNRGIVLQDMGQPIQAIAAFSRALAIAPPNSDKLRTRLWGNIARSRLAAGQIGKAEQAIRIGWAITSQRGTKGERPDLLSIEADIALKQGRLTDAGRFVDQSFVGLDLAATITPLYRKMHETAYRTYQALGRSGPAFAHLLALKRIDDEATKLATSASTALMGARFDFANQELRIATLKAEELRRSVAFEQARVKAQRLLFLGGAGATVVVILLLGISLITIRRSRNEVRAANIDLADTNLALGKALAAKNEFLATTSHEIRTPLNGILGMTQVMLAEQDLTAGLRDRLSIVQGAGLTMKALVDDILDVAKLETGKITIEDIAFDLARTIGDATGLWEEQARTKGLTFAVDLGACPAMVMGDPARLRQIVFNLLGNAMKFTATGGIAVTAAVDADGERFRVAVADSGIGIASEQQAAIFEAFRQADAGTTRLYGGTGLGLSICRNLARAMGGDVTVASQLGEGATFTLTLPLRRAQPAEVCEQLPDAPAGTLLVVERNPIARGMWRGLLGAHAPALAFAGSVGEALDLLECGGIVRLLVDDATVRQEPAIAVAVGRLAAAAAAAGVPMTLLWNGGDAPTDAAGEAARILAKPLSGAEVVAALFTASGERDLVSKAA